MQNYLPDPIRNLAQMFRELPGVGPKTALRFVFALLKRSPIDAEHLAESIRRLHRTVKTCANCWAYTMSAPCAICKDPNRDSAILCVVAESRDISTIEATGEFNGRYFVLGGLLSPLEGSTPDMLHMVELTTHLKNHPKIQEIILAFSPDLRGESTILYLSKRLADFPVAMSKLARGLPLGADLEYADEVTLADALRGRRKIETQINEKIEDSN